MGRQSRVKMERKAEAILISEYRQLLIGLIIAGYENALYRVDNDLTQAVRGKIEELYQLDPLFIYAREQDAILQHQNNQAQ